jgi:hypothetical protein
MGRERWRGEEKLGELKKWREKKTESSIWSCPDVFTEENRRKMIFWSYCLEYGFGFGLKPS